MSRILALATKYGRYGYRRITAMLRREGWRINHRRVERIWRQEGLKVPAKQPKMGRLWLDDGSCIRLRRWAEWRTKALELINELIENPPTFDPIDTDHVF